MRRRREAGVRRRASRPDSPLTPSSWRIGHVCYLGPRRELETPRPAGGALAIATAAPSRSRLPAASTTEPLPEDGQRSSAPGGRGRLVLDQVPRRRGPAVRRGDDKWYATNGSLPPGLTLSDNGQLSGTPTQAGTYAFWIEMKPDRSDNPDPPDDRCSSRDNSEEHVSHDPPRRSAARHRPRVGSPRDRQHAVLAADDGLGPRLEDMGHRDGCAANRPDARRHERAHLRHADRGRDVHVHRSRRDRPAARRHEDAPSRSATASRSRAPSRHCPRSASRSCCR